MSEWISVEGRRPQYGEPVLVVANGFVQSITFMRDGDDHCQDWYEPFYFDRGDECKIPWDKVTHWMPLPEPPK